MGLLKERKKQTIQDGKEYAKEKGLLMNFRTRLSNAQPIYSIMSD